MTAFTFTPYSEWSSLLQLQSDIPIMSWTCYERNNLILCLYTGSIFSLCYSVSAKEQRPSNSSMCIKFLLIYWVQKAAIVLFDCLKIRAVNVNALTCAINIMINMWNFLTQLSMFLFRLNHTSYLLTLTALLNTLLPAFLPVSDLFWGLTELCIFHLSAAALQKHYCYVFCRAYHAQWLIIITVNQLTSTYETPCKSVQYMHRPYFRAVNGIRCLNAFFVDYYRPIQLILFEFHIFEMGKHHFSE